MEDAGLDAEGGVELAFVEYLAYTDEPSRVVQLVAVHAQHPRSRADVGLEHPVGLARMSRPTNVEMVQLHGEPSQNVPRPIRGDVVDSEDSVAEARNVPDRLLDVDVLVADENDPYDLHAQSSSVVHSSSGRTTPCH